MNRGKKSEHVPNYENNLRIFDSLISQFPNHQSFCTNYKLFRQGVSVFVKNSLSGPTANRDKSTIGLGGLDHQYVPSLFLQMFLCIGGTGDLLPTNRSWKPNRGEYKPFNHLGNITEIVHSSGYILFDIHKAFERGEYSVDQILDLHEMVKTAQIHFHRLYNLKQCLCNSNIPYKGTKLHSLLHLVEGILENGAPKVFDMIR